MLTIKRSYHPARPTQHTRTALALPNAYCVQINCARMTSQSSNESHWSANSTPIVLSATSSLTLPPHRDESIDDPPPEYTETSSIGERTFDRGPGLSASNRANLPPTVQPASAPVSFDEWMRSILRRTNAAIGHLAEQAGRERRLRRVGKSENLRQMYRWEGEG